MCERKSFKYKGLSGTWQIKAASEKAEKSEGKAGLHYIGDTATSSSLATALAKLNRHHIN